MEIKIKLDLELGRKRYKKDLKDMCSADHPYETILIEENLKEYLSTIESKLDNFTPIRSEIIYIPKPNHHIRPGSNLSPEDAIIPQAITLYDTQKIGESMLWGIAGHPIFPLSRGFVY